MCEGSSLDGLQLSQPSESYVDTSTHMMLSLTKEAQRATLRIGLSNANASSAFHYAISVKAKWRTPQ
jgi:hypothetical protein